jgi:hypothetical protein
LPSNAPSKPVGMLIGSQFKNIGRHLLDKPKQTAVLTEIESKSLK